MLLPALYRSAVYYLRVVCGEILLVPDVLSVVFHVILCYVILCLLSGGGGGGRFPSLVGWGVTHVLLGFLRIASLCG